MEPEEFRNRFQTALNNFMKREIQLLEMSVNERTLTAKLAMYLTSAFPEYDVDCEYNRHRQDTKMLEIKTHKASAPLDDIEARTIFPDILIHKRQQDITFALSKSSNLSLSGRQLGGPE